MHTNRVAVIRLFGILALASVCSLTAYAADPVTDGIVWTKGYPLQVANGAKTRFTIAGSADVAKYKEMKITSKNPTYWYVVKLKDDGTEDADSTKKFKLNLYLDRRIQGWDAGTQKEIDKNGLEVDFPGFAPGTYRVKVAVKVKETATSEERDAKLDKDVPIPAP